MSHKEQLNFVEKVKQLYPDYFKKKLVLEIGSLNINGSIRSFFEQCTYIGLDIDKGLGVDVVGLGHEYDLPDNSFDTTISCECFEHDPYWELTFKNMIRLTKENGLVMFSCATTGRKEHGTMENEPESSPLTVKHGWSYYKNLTEEDFKQKLNFENLFISYEFAVNEECCDLYFHGIKK